MYDSDAAVERDVAKLRRKLKEEEEEPADRQTYVSRYATSTGRVESRKMWWVVVVAPAAGPVRSSRTWFYFERNKGSGWVDVKDPTQNMKVVATLPTVESAYFAGAISIERPS